MLRLAEQPPGQAGDHRPLADVAEHAAEHQQEGDGEQGRGVHLAVFRDAVLLDQHGEGLEQAVAHRDGGDQAAFVRARIPTGELEGQGERCAQALLQAGDLAGGNPAGEVGELALAADRGVQPHQGLGQHQDLGAALQPLDEPV